MFSFYKNYFFYTESLTMHKELQMTPVTKKAENSPLIAPQSIVMKKDVSKNSDENHKPDTTEKAAKFIGIITCSSTAIGALIGSGIGFFACGQPGLGAKIGAGLGGGISSLATVGQTVSECKKEEPFAEFNLG